MRAIIACCRRQQLPDRRLKDRATVGDYRGTEFRPIYMQAKPKFTAAIAQSQGALCTVAHPRHTRLPAVNTGVDASSAPDCAPALQRLDNAYGWQPLAAHMPATNSLYHFSCTAGLSCIISSMACLCAASAACSIFIACYLLASPMASGVSPVITASHAPRRLRQVVFFIVYLRRKESLKSNCILPVLLRLTITRRAQPRLPPERALIDRQSDRVH